MTLTLVHLLELKSRRRCPRAGARINAQGGTRQTEEITGVSEPPGPDTPENTPASSIEELAAHIRSHLTQEQVLLLIRSLLS